MQKKVSKHEVTLGERIKQLRNEREWTREILGEKIGIHWQTLGLYEKNGVIPSALVLKKIAEAFGVTADYLLFGESDNIPMSKISDKELLKRIEKLDKIQPESKDALYKIMDVFIRENAAKEALAAS